MKLDLATLMKWCAPQDFAPGLALGKPFRQGKRVFASNGSVLLAVDASRVTVNVEEEPKAPDAAGILSKYAVSPEADLPCFPSHSGETQTCLACDGDGKGFMECNICNGSGHCRCPECDAEYECAVCRESGQIRKNTPCEDCQGTGETLANMQIARRWFTGKDVALCAELSKKVKELRYDPAGGPNEPLHFVFDGGEGLLSPIRE